MTGLYLSRARLRDDNSVRAIAPLLLPDDIHASLSAAHRMVWSLMSDDPDRRRDFLWREEGPGAFLILGPRPAEAGGLFAVESKPWAPQLRAGDRLGFLLRANATVSRSAVPGSRGARGRRHDVVMDVLYRLPHDERAAQRRGAIAEAGQVWLTRQGLRAGFVPEANTLNVDGYDTVRVARGSKENVMFGRLECEGVLQVTDPTLFLREVAAGLGRAKAFGCGLMLLRRV